DVPLDEGERRLGDRVGPLRTGPRERDDRMARVRRAMDRHAALALTGGDAQASDPGDERLDGEWPRAGGHVRAESDERVAARAALAVPRPSPAERDLDLDPRLRPA